MSIFLLKTLNIRGGWGLCPQTPLAYGGWGLCPYTPVWGTPFAESWVRHWKSLYKVLPPPPEILGWLRHRLWVFAVKAVALVEWSWFYFYKWTHRYQSAMSEKRKCSEEHKIFQKWKELYFVCNSNDKVQCSICYAIFSTMKINQSALRTRLTDEHLHAVLRIQINVKSGQTMTLS